MRRMSTSAGDVFGALPETQQQLRDMCRDFAEQELKPNAAEWDKNHQ